MKPLLGLLAAALATLVFSFAWDGPAASDALTRGGQPGAGRARIAPVAGAAAAPRLAVAAPRVHCPRPATLRLRRFEDGSARLECAGRLLVRVSVPG